MNFKSNFPLVYDLGFYTRSKFNADLIAGFTVAVMLVPQGMAYAFLAGMPPIYGLYGGLIPVFLYPLLGSCRQLSIGPVAISSLLILSGVSGLAEIGSDEYIRLVIFVGLLVGILQTLLGFLRMGFLANFLSHPVVAGFTSAAAVIIAISQFKDLLGISIPRYAHPHETIIYTLEHLGQTNWLSVVFCVGAIMLMLLIKKINKKLPGALIVVILSTLLSWYFNLGQQFQLDIVGAVPSGLPAFDLPMISGNQFIALMPTVLTVTLIGIVEGIGIAKVLEARHHTYVVRPNQELLALGISKIGGSLFQSLPTSASFTRSAINDSTGARTGLSSVITACLIGLTLIFMTSLFYYLPKAVLAAIILMAVKSLFDHQEARYLWATHRQDFLMMLVTFIITLLVGIEAGVFLGVILSVLAVLYRSTSPHFAELGKLPDSSQFRNVSRFKKVIIYDDIAIGRFDDQLYFGNASFFKDRIRELVEKRNYALKVVILDASNMHDIDSSGLHALEEISIFLERHHIKLNICNAIGPVRDMLFKSGMINRLGQESQFLDVNTAVAFHKNQIRGWSEDALQTNVKDNKKPED